MMKMNPAALTNIRKEFFAREDEISLEEFIYIIQKHLVNKPGDDSFVMETPDQREFGLNMYELFKDIDVNGDGMLEWQEFTSFTVEKANLLNKRAKLTSIAHYHDSSRSLDPSATYRHRHDISKFVNIPLMGQFAMLEDHKNAIYVFNSRQGKHISTITTDSAPIAVETYKDRDRISLITSGADMTLSTYNLDDPNPKRRHKLMSTWACTGVQISLAYAQENRTLYSGATNGSIYSWNIRERNLTGSLTGHTDIVMKVLPCYCYCCCLLLCLCWCRFDNFEIRIATFCCVVLRCCDVLSQHVA
jgi:WD40 repeat protein